MRKPREDWLGADAERLLAGEGREDDAAHIESELRAALGEAEGRKQAAEEAARAREEERFHAARKRPLPKGWIAAAAALFVLEGALTVSFYRNQGIAEAEDDAPVFHEPRIEAADACRSAMVAITAALGEYARRHDGDYPESLAKLREAGYLDEIPTDPKTGEAFVYVRERGTFSLAAPDPEAYGVAAIKTTLAGHPIIVLRGA